jgi:hypothetical protein
VSLQSLADALIREASTLLASVATRDGSRMPLSRVPDRLFHGLACELHSMQVRRRVAADMFGMVPRAYLRKVRRAEDSVTDYGYSLWQAVYEFIAGTQGVELAALGKRFRRDDEGVLRGVLSDLRESGLVTTVGRGPSTEYRATTGRELGARLATRRDGSDELVWAVIYREGPLYRETLKQVVGLADADLDAILLRLKEDGRIYERPKRDRILLCSASSVPDHEAPESWEATFFEHFHAAVRTLSTLLSRPEAENTAIGTFTFNLWPGHPLAGDVERLLVSTRAEANALRARIDAVNANTTPPRFQRVMLYLGMCEDRPRVIESPSTASPEGLDDPELEQADELEGSGPSAARGSYPP